jgi:hypothetical protein
MYDVKACSAQAGRCSTLTTVMIMIIIIITITPPHDHHHIKIHHPL